MEKQKQSRRLLSLDALRGFDMFFIMGGASLFVALATLFPNPFFQVIGDQMHHVKWDGLTHHDTIFPLFLFIAGISFPFSLEKQREQGKTDADIYRKIIRRGLTLVVLGFVYNGLLNFDFEHQRYASVLGRIGLAWMFGALIFVNTRTITRVWITVAILVGYWLLLAFVPAPDGNGAGVFTMEGSLVGYVDRLLLPGRLHLTVHDPEGILSTVPAVATALLGMFTGEFIKMQREGLTDKKKVGGLVIAGAVLLAVGLLWSLFFPINKNLWTSSFVCVVGAYSVWMFALFFYVALSQMTKYLDQIDHGIENIISESTDPIHLITELKPIEIRLNEIKATLKRQELEASEGEKKKNDLVLFLAHDLKTPLTSIVAYLTMLEDHPDMPEEERKAYTHIALEKSIRLGELINEFFDITRYNLQNIELEPVEIDLTMMLEQLADELYGVLQEKKLTCEVDVEEDLMIYGDPDKLARVFDNILRNAIAYCYADTEIRIEAKMKDGDIEITFTNAGDKIPGDMLQTIFEKFYRVDGSRSTGTGGAGLGLAIAKQIVELHGGRILAKSDDNRTQFVVTLPSKEKTEQKEGSEDEVHTHRRLAFRGKAGRGKRVQSK